MQICLSECPHSVLYVQISADCVCRETYFPFAECCSSSYQLSCPPGQRAAYTSLPLFWVLYMLSLVSAQVASMLKISAV